MANTQRDLTMKRLVGGLALLVMCGSALATTDTVKTIDHLGVQGTGAYFSVLEGFSQNCLFNNIYLDLTNDGGRAAFQELLTAKNFGIRLSRIDYTQNGGPGSQCFLSLVEIQN